MKNLSKFAYLSITAALATIGLKFTAYLLTGSVGILSDALESVINLIAAVIALIAIRVSQKPPDEKHMYGHSKAEYFSSIIEGLLIFAAAISIGYAAIIRLMHPQPIEQAYFGIAIATFASVINLIAGLTLLKAGKKYRSITLEADAHHLFTDVWTSAGVILGVIVVAVTRLNILDPIVALLVAFNILYTGYRLITKSAEGFMDTAIEDIDSTRIRRILAGYKKQGVKFHALKTRQSAAKTFMSVHMLVPENWTMKKANNMVEKMEKDIRTSFINIDVLTHLETIEDPRSQKDIDLLND
ncbi:cation diffusion facilitator family transporter [Patescibacteria group bacterium]|nr:cation diffusion facilitator family transporter [Patescibacteria group bacterium]